MKLDQPPEPERYDKFSEIAVNGKPVLRIEDQSERERSDIETAVIVEFIDRMADEIIDRFDEEHDISPSELIAEAEPDICLYNSEVNQWETGEL